MYTHLPNMTSHPRMPQAISIESDGSDLPEGEFMFQGAILSTSIVRITKSGGGGGGGEVFSRR